MFGRLWAGLALGAGLAMACASSLDAHEADWSAAAVASPERFSEAIEGFAEADAARPPQPCSYLFVGSSSIRLWKSLSADMAPLPVINRGFGGSRIADVDYYFDQLVAPYHPRAIVFYAGENDLAAGEGAGSLLGDFRRFMALKTQRLGDTPVFFISLKPSRRRAAQRLRQEAVNAEIQAFAAQRHDLTFVDVTPAMLDADGRPRPDLFGPDGLHMRHEGYALWAAALKPALAHAAARRCKAPAPAEPGLPVLGDLGLGSWARS